jgi:hypothetical protein
MKAEINIDRMTNDIYDIVHGIGVEDTTGAHDRIAEWLKTVELINIFTLALEWKRKEFTKEVSE